MQVFNHIDDGNNVERSWLPRKIVVLPLGVNFDSQLSGEGEYWVQVFRLRMPRVFKGVTTEALVSNLLEHKGFVQCATPDIQKPAAGWLEFLKYTAQAFNRVCRILKNLRERKPGLHILNSLIDCLTVAGQKPSPY